MSEKLKIGEVAGVKVYLSPEQYEEYKKEKIIEENKILKEQEQEIKRLNNIINNDFSKICREEMIDKLSAHEMI